MVNFSTFRKDIEAKNILKNGRRIYRESLIEDINHYYEDNYIFKSSANVTSESDPSSHYEVELLIEDDVLEKFSCECPYYRRNGRMICKHVIGILFYIEANDLYSKNSKEKNKKFNATKEAEEETKVIDTTLGFEKVHKEIECQICLQILERPIMMPCCMHSVCSHCCKKLLSTNKKFKRVNEIACPTCSNSAGIFEIEQINDLKINKELERVIEAYKSERTMWFNEKNQLMKDVNDLKGERKKEILEDEKKEIDLSGKNAEELSKIIKKCQELKKIKNEEEKEAKKKEKVKKLNKRKMEISLNTNEKNIKEKLRKVRGFC